MKYKLQVKCFIIIQNLRIIMTKKIIKEKGIRYIDVNCR